MRSIRRGPQLATISVLPLMVGGCAASMQSIHALQATRYASSLRRAGIAFVHTPRHADVLLLAGAVTAASRQELRRVLARVPQPRVIVAVGNCAIDGCIFSANECLLANVADAHAEIAGCPPAPEAILASIVTARRLLTGDDTATTAPDTAAATRVDGVRSRADGEALVGARDAEEDDE